MAPLTASTPDTVVSLALARFIHKARWEAVPQGVRHEIKRALMNYFAVALAGSSDPTIEKAVHTYGRFSSANDATLAGRAERMDVLNASALNAMSANVFDFDDTHIPTIIHPTAPVAAVLFALSETTRIPGPAFMLALLLGIEAECRIGMAISPFHYGKGWHITSTCGVFGSAMATGKILGLTDTQLCWALGTASGQAGGMVETLGTMAKSVSVGNAARNGLLAALLAQENFDGPIAPLEGKYGFLRVFGNEPDFGMITARLGEAWEIEKTAYKPYPCGVVLNPVLDACLALTERPEMQHIDMSDIESIELTGHPLLRQRTDRPGARNGRESQVSAQHAVPIALLRRRAGLEEFSDQAVSDADVRALGRRIRFQDDEHMSIDAAVVTLRLRGMAPIEQRVDVARGALENPLTDVALEAKLRDLCRYGRSGCDADRIIDAVWHIDSTEDAGSVIRLAAAPQAARR